MKNRRWILGIFALLLTWAASAQRPGDRNAASLTAPYKGIFFGGDLPPGLFPLRTTGASTEPVRKAAEAFLAGLNDAQRQATLFPIDDLEWRKWSNVHMYARQGVSFLEMNDRQRELAFGLLRAALSAKGLSKTQDCMKLNGTLAELMNNTRDYGEWLYFLTVMGKPSATEPWGFQLDGHHAVINYFIRGDQVVMTPTFMGAEPVIAQSGKFAGTAVLQDEQNKGLALLTSLSREQRRKAVVETSKTGNNNLSEAFHDNLNLDFVGIPASELTAGQKDSLLDVISEYVGNMDSGHAKVKMEEVRGRLEQTYFAWIGGVEPDGVFYYRIQSPVILIEFDHQLPVALGGPRVPGRRHIHTVVRTPNGNDYGKDLLRQHYEQSHGLRAAGSSIIPL